MRLSFALSLVCLGLALPLAAQVPVMNTVQPKGGTVGAVLHVSGVYLDKSKVEEVYLSDHTLDMKVKVLAQSQESIDFRIPPSVQPGKLQLVIKTAGKEPLIIEQPLYVTVEEPKDPGKQIAAAR